MLWGAVGAARGPLIQKGLGGLLELATPGKGWIRCDSFSLDQESAQYLCSEGVEPLEPAERGEGSLRLQRRAQVGNDQI